MEEIWNAKIPLKVRNFLWMVFQGRVQTTDNLSKKAWKGENKCKICLEEESVDHLIFTCPLPAFIWSVIKEGLNWERLSRSVKKFNDECLLQRGDKLNSMLFFLFGEVCWTVWLNRNDFIFKNKIIPNPNAILYRLLYFMQRWTTLSLWRRGQVGQAY
jgi:hypothetical protein